ncbi:MAG: hypothetical protein RLZZ165_183 [Bacteroidota bacterium]|jgi:hypothetical protein
MKTRMMMVMGFTAVVLSGCSGTQMISAGTEVDDVYYNQQDQKADQKAMAQARAQAQTARAMDVRENPENASNPEGSYDRGLAEKNGETEGSASTVRPYADDDYYYSRQVRRFNSTSWNYFDPYYSYDPYYAIGTPTWNSVYNNRPWWYDPYFYNGPSYAWTSNWGMNGYNPYYTPFQMYNQPWSGWSVGYGSPFSNGYNAFGYPYQGFGGNALCPGMGFYGGNGGIGYFGNAFGSEGAPSATTFSHRVNPSSLNTADRPGNQPILNARSTRPYQGNYPVVVTPRADPKTYDPIPSTGRLGNVQPSSNGTNSRPTTNTFNNHPTMDHGYSRPRTESQARPAMDRGSSRPSTENAASRPTYSAPSRDFQSSPRPSFSSPSGGGAGRGLGR